NARIDFAHSPFYLPSVAREWKSSALPRRAAVNSLGIGGTNAFVVLEEAPPRSASESSRPYQLLTLSAKTTRALEESAFELAGFLREKSVFAGACGAYTLHMGRRE